MLIVFIPLLSMKAFRNTNILPPCEITKNFFWVEVASSVLKDTGCFLYNR